jgi:TRAP-type uncharacterized transport system substrate-binding protein
MARMNARMMRGKMALEVAAEIYTRHMFSLGNVVTVSIKPSAKEEQFSPLRLGINGDVMGGLQAPIEVAKKRVDIGFVNPSAIVTMAYRGKGFYKQKLPLRALASFPSWDRIAFAVSKELKLKSLFEIGERKLPLNVSTRSSGVGNTTRYAVDKILSLYGLSFASIGRRGGKVEECPRPTSDQRIDSIKTGKVNAVFDEGLHTWLPTALDHGFEVLPLEPKILRQLELLGFQRAVLPQDRFPKLGGDIQTIDFSGWPLITHRWLPNELAYAICEAIDARQGVIPIDDEHPLDMRKLCRSMDASPLGIPLHPGAKHYYREKGYL